MAKSFRVIRKSFLISRVPPAVVVVRVRQYLSGAVRIRTRRYPWSSLCDARVRRLWLSDADGRVLRLNQS